MQQFLELFTTFMVGLAGSGTSLIIYSRQQRAVSWENHKQRRASLALQFGDKISLAVETWWAATISIQDEMSLTDTEIQKLAELTIWLPEETRIAAIGLLDLIYSGSRPEEEKIIDLRNRLDTLV